MNKVKIIDSLPGSGKTTYIFDLMKQHPTEKWLYVSPYLSEVGDDNTKGRIRTTLPELKFKTPSDNGYGKKDDIKDLIDSGENIATTHQLFKSFNDTICNSVGRQEYHLVIDETVDMITAISGVTRDDIEMLRCSGFLSVDDNTGKISWLKNKYKGRWDDVKKLAEADILYVYKDYILMTKLSPRVIECAKSVHVLTYMFDSSVMKYFMDIHKIPYKHIYPESLLSARELKQNLRDNIELVHMPRRLQKLQTNGSNTINMNFMSSTWFDKNHRYIEDIRVCLENTVSNGYLFFPAKIFWTTFKKVQEELESSKYSREFCEAFNEPVMDQTELRSGSWVPKNKRASNEYADCTGCIVACNTFMYLPLKNYINDTLKAANSESRCSDDDYALSELVQFIFRGSVRKNEKMRLLICSYRMKRLFTEWLAKDY